MLKGYMSGRFKFKAVPGLDVADEHISVDPMFHENHYDFKAPKGFHERHDIMSEFLPQCPKCEVFTNDPEHNCGSVALVTRGNCPQLWNIRMMILTGQGFTKKFRLAMGYFT